jgi:regulator of cell morphogenesis and NO signaling
VEITPQTRVADIAQAHPAASIVFERHQIDFRRSGERPIGEVCAEQQLSFAGLKAELEELITARPSLEASWRNAPLDELVDFLVIHEHIRLKEDLIRIARLSLKVLESHGTRHPYLRDVVSGFRGLRLQLEGHMDREERLLTMAVRHAVAGALGTQAADQEIGKALEDMTEGHLDTLALMDRIRAAAQEYALPEDSDTTLVALYHLLEKLEDDVDQHFLLERSILFPRLQDAQGPANSRRQA